MAVIQPVLDCILYDNFCEVFNGSPLLDIHGSNEELKQFSQKLSQQLIDIDLNNQSLTVDESNLCHSNHYLLPSNNRTTINSLNELPTINQILNNHFKFFISPEYEKNIHLFNIECRFNPLLVRSDGLAVVSISHIETSEVICEPPNHELPGIVLKSCPLDVYRTNPYIPICLMNLNYYTLYDYTFDINDDEHRRFDWSNSLKDYNQVRNRLMIETNDNERERMEYYNKYIHIYIDGGVYC